MPQCCIFATPSQVAPRSRNLPKWSSNTLASRRRRCRLCGSVASGCRRQLMSGRSPHATSNRRSSSAALNSIPASCGNPRTRCGLLRSSERIQDWRAVSRPARAAGAGRRANPVLWVGWSQRRHGGALRHRQYPLLRFHRSQRRHVDDDRRHHDFLRLARPCYRSLDRSKALGNRDSLPHTNRRRIFGTLTGGSHLPVFPKERLNG